MLVHTFPCMDMSMEKKFMPIKHKAWKSMDDIP